MASSSFLSESARWKAVRTRDATADGLFVYAVRTTRIYCRPVCKTRLARQANVTFYDNAEAAERDGYRACKRCKPHIVGLMPDETAVQQIRALIEHTLPAMQTGDIAGLFSLTKLANQAGVSKWHFHRVFKDVTGVTPMEYMRRQNQLDKSSLDVEASGHQLHASIESNLTTTSPEWATEAEDSGKEVNSDDFLISLKTLYACIGQTPDKYEYPFD